MPVNTDGEIVTSTPAKFIVHPRAITVFAPAGEKTAKPGKKTPTPRNAKAA
jgi:diacylglycerol kinase family enzyme